MTPAPATQAAPQTRETIRRPPALKVIESRKPRERRGTTAGTVGTMLTVVLFACVFGIVVFQVLLVQTQSRLDLVNREISQEVATEKVLRNEIANLESPVRIVGAARERLGMFPPVYRGDLRPAPDDDARAQYDPAKEPMPAPVTTTIPQSAPTTVTPTRATPTTVASRTPTSGTSTDRATPSSGAKAGNSRSSAAGSGGVTATTTGSRTSGGSGSSSAANPVTTAAPSKAGARTSPTGGALR